jgi:hypothetical protein
MNSRINGGLAEDKVDRRVVRDVVADGEVDPLGRGREVRTLLGVRLRDVQLVGGADTGLEQNARRAEGTGGQDDAAVRVERVVTGVRAHAGGLGAVAGDSLDSRVRDELEV